MNTPDAQDGQVVVSTPTDPVLSLADILAQTPGEDRYLIADDGSGALISYWALVSMGESIDGYRLPTPDEVTM